MYNSINEALTRACTTMFFAITLAFLAVVMATPALADVIPQPTVEEQLFSELNEARKDAGLPALKYDDRLEQDGDIRAAESSVVWSHQRPDGTEWYAVDEALMYGENLYKGTGYEHATEMWLNSPAHAANVFSPDFTTVGFGIYQIGDDFYIAEEFGIN